MVPAPPTADWVTLGKSCPLSELVFLSEKWGKNNELSWEVERAEYQEVMREKHLAQGLACSRSSQAGHCYH